MVPRRDAQPTTDIGFSCLGHDADYDGYQKREIVDKDTARLQMNDEAHLQP